MDSSSKDNIILNPDGVDINDSFLNSGLIELEQYVDKNFKDKQLIKFIKTHYIICIYLS